jgi:hypothetical protein
MESNHRIGALQTAALTTWRRRPDVTDVPVLFLNPGWVFTQGLYNDYTELK